jgi:hypothetical protein
VTPISRASAALGRFSTWLLVPIDAAWLGAFRILFGLVMAVSMARFVGNDLVEPLFVEPSFHFKYWGFEWVEPLPGAGMHWLFAALVALALSMALGLVFRLSAALFALGLTYIQLIDVSTYLNHYYLASLLAFLLSVSPAARTWSLDAWLAARRGERVEPQVARAWHVLFRAQIGLVYFFAGIAKAQPDWLIHGQPLRIWLGANTELPVLGALFMLPGAAVVMSWCGFLFDTTIVGFLLWGRTRPFAYAVVILFHTVTRTLFPIGMFPVIMVLSALVFFSPGWPRRLGTTLRSLATRLRVRPAVVAAPGPEGVSRPETALGPEAARPFPLDRRAKLGLAIGGAYCLIQLLMPLRTFVYGGNVLWHEQGMRFSWRVMVRAKGGSTTFVVRRTDTGAVAYVNPREILTSLQEAEMSGQPDLILQVARHLEERLRERGFGPVEVFADSRVSLNGRRAVRFIDPAVDLSRVSDSLDLRFLVLPAPHQRPPHTRPVL